MNLLLSCFLLVVYSYIANTFPTFETKRKHVRNHFDPKSYLSTYGFMDNRRRHMHQSRRVFRQAVRSFQEFNHLKKTGKLNRKTLKLMKKARCGVQDVKHTDIGKRRQKRNSNFKNAVYSPYGLKWVPTHLTWRISRYSGRLPASQQWASMKKAFELWEAAIPLTLTPNLTHPDMDVMFGRWSHGDGDQYSFDGRGPQLAHAFGPGDANIAGDIHFDEDESWTLFVNDTNSRDFLAVALHEVGHALGMPHSRDKNAVMYAQYKGYDPNIGLQYDDLLKIQYLYGARVLPVTRDQTTTQTPVKKKYPRGCPASFDDVIHGIGGKTYVFSGRHIYTLSGVDRKRKKTRKTPYRIRKVLRGAPIHIAAAVYLREQKTIYIFKGFRVWRYTRFRLDEGFPKRVRPQCEDRPRAVVGIQESDGKTVIYVFGSGYFWIYDTSRDEHGRCMWTSSFWVGLPVKPEAAVQWHDGSLYFFKKDKYYKVSAPHRSVMAGYPRLTSEWLGPHCNVSMS